MKTGGMTVLTNVATVVIAICCVVVTGLRFTQGAAGPTVTETILTPEVVSDWKELSAVGQRMGPATAAVVLTEFADFQCPFCARLTPVLREIRAAYPNDVAIVFRHYPIRSHPFARQAAFASECAGDQGRFSAFLDTVMATQDSIGKRSWTTYARMSGVPDTARFNRCLRDSTFAPRIVRDETAGKGLKVRGTPTLLVNAQRMKGALTRERVEKLVKDELSQARKDRGSNIARK